MKSKNLNEEIYRIKSLFNDSRLYGNLITEATGRWSWLEDLRGLIDDAMATLPPNARTKWSEFTMLYKGIDDVVGYFRTAPEFRKALDEIPEFFGGTVLNKLTGDVTRSIDPTYISRNYIDAIINELKRNGAKMDTWVDYLGNGDTLENHIKTIFNESNAKQSLDDLQKNIEEILSMDAVYMDEYAEESEKLWKKLQDDYDIPLNELKGSSGDDLLDLIKNQTKVIKSTDTEAMKGVTKMIEDLVKAKAQVKMNKSIEDMKRLKGEWALKYMDRIIDTTVFQKMPASLQKKITTDSFLIKFFAELKAFDVTKVQKDGNEAIWRFMGDVDDAAFPIINRKSIEDLFLKSGPKMHYAVAKSFGLKNWKEQKRYIKALFYSIYTTEIVKLGYLGWDTLAYLNSKKIGVINPTPKNTLLIWDFSDKALDLLAGTCYERLGADLYDEGELEEEDLNIEGKTQEKYIAYVINERDRLIDALDKQSPSYDNDKEKLEDWTPEDFCKYFVCKDGVPSKVNCNKYIDILGQNKAAEEYESREALKDFYIATQDTLRIVTDKLGKDGKELLDKINTKKEQSAEEIKAQLDKLSPEELKQYLEAIKEANGINDIKNTTDGVKEVNQKMKEKEIM